MEWNAKELHEKLGKASWQWDFEFGMHIPVCSGYRVDGLRLIRCDRGPLSDPEIDGGLCSEGPHVHPIDLPPRLAQAMREHAKIRGSRDRRP